MRVKAQGVCADFSAPAVCSPSHQRAFWPRGCWGLQSNLQCRSVQQWTSGYGTRLGEKQRRKREREEGGGVSVSAGNEGGVYCIYCRHKLLKACICFIWML